MWALSRGYVHITKVYAMDEGTLKTKSLNVVFTGHFILGCCSNFVGSESGQKRSVKLLQNMVYNTTLVAPTLFNYTEKVLSKSVQE